MYIYQLLCLIVEVRILHVPQSGLGLESTSLSVNGGILGKDARVEHRGSPINVPALGQTEAEQKAETNSSNLTPAITRKEKEWGQTSRQKNQTHLNRLPAK